MIEALKEDLKNSIKEREEKTNKTLGEKKIPKREPRKSNQTGEGNSSRLEN